MLFATVSISVLQAHMTYQNQQIRSTDIIHRILY